MAIKPEQMNACAIRWTHTHRHTQSHTDTHRHTQTHRHTHTMCFLWETVQTAQAECGAMPGGATRRNRGRGGIRGRGRIRSVSTDITRSWQEEWRWWPLPVLISSFHNLFLFYFFHSLPPTSLSLSLSCTFSFISLACHLLSKSIWYYLTLM